MTDSLSAEEISRAFWVAMTPPGIKLRWSPALVAKLAKIHESEPVPWKSEPKWLRVMPQLITWRVIEDLCGARRRGN